MFIKWQGSVSRLIVLVSLLALLAGCGGGGGGGGDDGGTAGSESSTAAGSTISGVAAKGPILGGTVTVYAIDASGNYGAPVGSGLTSTVDGTYSVSIGSYTGNVVVNITGGSYKDEATGNMVTNTSIKAALTNVSGNVTLAVTSLTDLAVRLAPNLSSDSINQYNTLVSSIVRFDILGTLPADVTSDSSKNASQDRISYGLMLASISQLSLNQGITQDQVVSNLKDDLADGKLNSTGEDLAKCLATFIASSFNKTSVTSSSQTPLHDALPYAQNNTATPDDQGNSGNPSTPDNTADLAKAKNMVAEIRNTVLSMYNYKGVGAAGIFDTPFKNLTDEIELELQPDLLNTMDRIQWLMDGLDSMRLVAGADNWQKKPRDFDDIFDMIPWDLWARLNADGKTITFYITPLGLATFDPTSVSDLSKVIDSGTIVINGLVLDAENATTINDTVKPTSGSINAEFKTSVSGKAVTVVANYNATFDGDYYKSMTFTGSLTVPDELTVDFSTPGRGLTVEFSPMPAAFVSTHVSFNDYGVYPSKVTVAGLVKTKTSQFTGTIDANGVFSTAFDAPVPTTATVTGTFEELLLTGSPSGTKFSGTVTGNWTNAGSFNPNALLSADNYPQWNATFDGKIESPSRPTLTANLTASQTAYNIYSLGVSFTRTNTDGTSVTFISGNATLNSTTGTLTAHLSNQNSLQVDFTVVDNDVTDSYFAGTIKTSGGTLEANLYAVDNAPVVKFVDNYVESLF